MTNRTYDVLGRLVMVESPQVSTVSYEVGGGVLSRVAASERPTQLLGYNTFGDLTHTEDGLGNVTVTSYDRLGRRTLITHSSYTSPVTGLTVSPTESYVYDLVGNLTGVTDRRGNVSSFEFDSLNRGVRRTDPQVGGLPVVSESVFDELGSLVKSTDPEGAVVRFEYDKLGRMISQTQVVGGVDLVSTFQYDKLGNQIESNPAGYGDTDRTTRVFSPAGELLKVTSPFTDVETTNQWFSYDVGGRNTKTTFHDDTYSLVTYDLAGRETRRGHHGSDATELAWTTTTYDSAGRVASTSTMGGAVTSYGYSDVGWVTSITEKVSSTVSVATGYGYDVLGNHTETTDGEGRVWAQTYNPWGLLERRVEPATAEYPALDERMFTTGYDPAGLAVAEVFPTGPEVVGGPDVTVEVARVFDVLGRPTSESSGGVVSSMTYDRVGRLMSVSHPSGTVSNTYDERGLLLSTSGPSGNTTYVYDEAGRLTSRVDPAGSAVFSWWPSGGLRTMSDGVSNVVRDYQWTRLGRLQSVVFGSGAHRDYVWSEVGRLVSDTLVDEDGFESYRAAYTYELPPLLRTVTVWGLRAP